VETEDLIFLSIMLLVIMAINLVSLLSVNFLPKYLSAETLEVANRILALLLAALAIETILNGVGELLDGVLSKMQGGPGDHYPDRPLRRPTDQTRAPRLNRFDF
jgi:hypothetical protein